MFNVIFFQLRKKGPPSAADKEEAERLKTEGNNLMRTEKFQEALEMYTKAIDLDGSNPEFYCNRAAAHSKMNNHHLAIEDCQRAIDMDPSYSKAYGRYFKNTITAKKRDTWLESSCLIDRCHAFLMV